MKLKVLYIAISIAILLNGRINSQPYQNYLVKRYIDTTNTVNQTIYKIVSVNLKTGEEKIILNETVADVFFTDPTCNWVLTGKHKDGFYIYNISITSNIISVPYDLIPNTIRYSKLRNKMYIFGDDYPSNSWNTKSLVVYNIVNSTYENNITLPYFTLDDYEPFFSADENKLYITVEDSVGVEYNDKSHAVIYSTITNNIINNVELKNLGYPNAGYYTVQRGRKGKGIIASYFKSSNEKYYQIYDFEKEISSSFIYSAVNANAYMLGDSCQYLALVELKKGLIEGKDAFDIPSGIVKIYDAKTAQLVKTLNYPEEKAIVFFDEYPNDIYPLAVVNNGVVQKFSVESLKNK